MNYPHTYPSSAPLGAELITPEQLLVMPNGKHFELVAGKLVEKNVGFESCWISSVLLTQLMNHCLAHKVGWVIGNEAGFRCYPDDANKVRKPDIAFVSFRRLPAGIVPTGYCVAAPNLVVEVVSPRDVIEDLDEKISEYLAAGVECIWVVEPKSRRVRVYYPDGGVILTENDELSAESIIPGFRCSLKELFTPPTP